MIAAAPLRVSPERGFIDPQCAAASLVTRFVAVSRHRSGEGLLPVRGATELEQVLSARPPHLSHVSWQFPGTGLRKASVTWATELEQVLSARPPHLSHASWQFPATGLGKASDILWGDGARTGPQWHGRLTCYTYRGSFPAQVWGRPSTVCGATELEQVLSARPPHLSHVSWQFPGTGLGKASSRSVERRN